LGSHWLISAGIYSDSIFDNNGCLSEIVSVDLSVSEALKSVTRDTLLCYGDVYRSSGETYTEEVQLVDTIRSKLGCDSLELLTRVTFTNSPRLILDTIQVCSDETIEIHGMEYRPPYIDSDTLLGSNNCDSLVRAIYYEPSFIVVPADLGHYYEGEIGDTLSILLTLDNDITIGTQDDRLVVTDDSIVLVYEQGFSEYVLAIEDNLGCDTIVLLSILGINELSTEDYYIPNVIDPTKDGSNGRFFLQSEVNSESLYDLSIYDRWGNLIYSGIDLHVNEATLSWDGTRSGNAAEPGVYVYMLQIDKEQRPRVGTLTLLR